MPNVPWASRTRSAPAWTRCSTVPSWTTKSWIYWSSTLIHVSYSLPGLRRHHHSWTELGYPNAARQRFVDAWREIVGNVRKAYDRGIPFAAGSDCGGLSHPHGRYARNVTLFVRECGLPVEDAIRAVTGLAAKAGWFDNTGTLKPIASRTSSPFAAT